MILTREQRWTCANCATTAVTRQPLPHTEMHWCKKNGMWAPMQPAGVRCKVELVEREDYIGKELVQTDGNGRPVMAVKVTRETGVDVSVYAPVAQGRRRD